MIVSDSQKEELKQQIRLRLVKNPKATCREVAKKLKIDKDTANNLINEVRNENAEKIQDDISRLSTTSLEDDLNNLYGEYEEIKDKLLIIADHPESTKSQQINALRAIIQSKIEIFKLKAHIGLFKEQSSKSELTMADLVALTKRN